MTAPANAHETPEERTERELREITKRHLEESRLADRDRRWDLARTCLQCFAWAGIGIFGILWSAHTTSLSWGRISFFSGVLVGNAGIIFTILSYWRRGEQRGDW